MSINELIQSYPVPTFNAEEFALGRLRPCFGSRIDWRGMNLCQGIHQRISGQD